MSASTKIEWTNHTWNPVIGCTKVSAGCKNCYAERMAHRLQAMGDKGYDNGFALTLRPDVLDAPLHWKKPRRIFVNSMSDLFHKDVPTSYIEKVFARMLVADHHQYQILTKRAERLAEFAKEHADAWWPHIWVGVSVENDVVRDRISMLQRVPTSNRFLSVEPLIGPLPNLDLTGIQLVIVGGESGPGARPMDPAWVRDIRDQCVAARVNFFFNQWGGVQKTKAGRVLDGRTWDQLPAFHA